MVKVSLFASAVRPKLWGSLFKSLEGTSVEYEVVFAGYRKDGLYVPELPLNTPFTYIDTANIKPAQCYEIARRTCTGEVVVWVADDCEFPNDVIGKAYKYWKEQNNDKLILSIQTKESGYNMPQGQLFDMDNHRLFGFVKETPLMAPLGMMSREFLQYLGGIDKRYTCGQYENDLVMRAYQNGARVEVFGGPNCYIDIDHLGKSILLGESKSQEDFLNRPFATGYTHDRAILENSWTTFDPSFFSPQAGQPRSIIRCMSKCQMDRFQPYEDMDILTKSQSYKGKWE